MTFTIIIFLMVLFINIGVTTVIVLPELKRRKEEIITLTRKHNALSDTCLKTIDDYERKSNASVDACTRLFENIEKRIQELEAKTSKRIGNVERQLYKHQAFNTNRRSEYDLALTNLIADISTIKQELHKYKK